MIQRKLLGSLLILFSTGCSLNQPRPDISAENANKVAKDFISALVKLQGHEPRSTMVQITDPRSVFAKSLETELRSAGYGIQYVKHSGQGDKSVEYAKDSFSTSNGTTLAYRLDVGTVSMGREYEIRAGAVYPISALSLRGGKSTVGATLDTRHFESGKATRTEQVSGTREPWAQPIRAGELRASNTSSPMIEIESAQLVGSAEKGNSATRSESRQIIENRSSGNGVRDYSAIRKKNLQNTFDLGHSNFKSLDKTHNSLGKRTLVFGYDSLVMGKRNKNILANFTRNYHQEMDDKYVVQGCSHGTTKLRDGNKVLALGRAERVREEMVLLGIDPQDVMTEGCWGPSSVFQGDIPPRAVVIKHKRRRFSG